MPTSHLDHPSAPAISPSIPSIPGTRASSSPTSSPASLSSEASAKEDPHSHTSQKLAELLRKAGSLSASPEAVQAMIDLGAPADDIVKFTAWMEGKLNGSLQ